METGFFREEGIYKEIAKYTLFKLVISLCEFTFYLNILFTIYTWCSLENIIEIHKNPSRRHNLNDNSFDLKLLRMFLCYTQQNLDDISGVTDLDSSHSYSLVQIC